MTTSSVGPIPHRDVTLLLGGHWRDLELVTPTLRPLVAPSDWVERGVSGAGYTLRHSYMPLDTLFSPTLLSGKHPTSRSW